MRIVCCECKARIGEKCPHCGSKDAVIQRWRKVDFISTTIWSYNGGPSGTGALSVTPSGVAICLLNDFFCLSCRRPFAPGEGGETHTYCDPCRAQLLAEARRGAKVIGGSL